jgi:hypothetical protein
MLNFDRGRAIAIINGKEYNNEILYIDSEDKKCCGCMRCSAGCSYKKCCRKCKYSSNLGRKINLRNSKLTPLPKINERSVDYIAGPSGSGKSSYAVNMAKIFKKVNPKSDIYIFSRTDIDNDPAFDGLDYHQVKIDESIITDPIDITELNEGCFILFDDCGTIQNDKYKKAVEKLMGDIMEVGRKLNIWITITNHLVIPNDKKFARTIMNEMQTLTVFPKSGSAQQIRYCLKNYYGMNNSQIDYILNLPSRWVTIHKNYPMCVVYETGAFIL